MMQLAAWLQDNWLGIAGVLAGIVFHAGVRGDRRKSGSSSGREGRVASTFRRRARTFSSLVHQRWAGDNLRNTAVEGFIVT
jgi:hypothetical protein